MSSDCTTIVPLRLENLHIHKLTFLSSTINNYLRTMEQNSDPEVSITRTLGRLDISKLSQPSIHDERPISSSAASTVNSQILYIKDHDRLHRGRLSSISNDSAIDLETEDAHQLNSTQEWTIADQEIFEWQYSCQTGQRQAKGRTFRCTYPVADKHNSFETEQVVRLSSEKEGLPLVDVVSANDDGHCKNDRQHELARLAAMQMLGSCYTLPMTPGYHADGRFDKDQSHGIPSPTSQLIDSLDKHSQHHHSFPLDQDAQTVTDNSNEVNRFDGSSSILLPHSNSLPDSENYDHTSAMAEETTFTPRDKQHFLRFYECRSSYKKRRCNTMSLVMSQPRRFQRWRSRTDQGFSKDIGELEDFATLLLSRTRNQAPKTAKLSHDIPLHPVKDVVLQRWKSLAKRVGNIRDRRHSLVADEDLPSRLPSPTLSATGKERRRRAQQESEIDGDVGGAQHLNSPVAESLLPLLSDHDTVYSSGSEEETPRLHLANPRVAAAEFVKASKAELGDSLGAQTKILAFPASPTLPLSRGRSMIKSSKSSKATRQKSPPSARSLSQRRSHTRGRRKSMLSEVYTQDDLDGGAAGRLCSLQLDSTTLPSAIEEVKTPSPARYQLEWLIPGRNDVRNEREPTEKKDVRPEAVRLSTSGTQVYRPV